MSYSLEAPWSEFKTFVVNRSLSIQWLDISENYYLSAHDGPFSVSCLIPKKDPASSDQVDFETNFKTLGNQSFSDSDGSAISRVKASKKGWVFGIIPIEATTAKLNSVYSKLVDDTDRPGITYKIYDANGNEITTPGVLGANEATAVKTVIEFEPTNCYELIGGELQQKSKPASPVRIWVVAVPDIAAPNGSKEMIGGVNLEFIDPSDKIRADGRVSKYMQYSATYHTNKLQFTFKHNAGVQHPVMIMLEVFRA